VKHFVIDEQDRATLDLLRRWLSNLVRQNKVARSEMSNAADYAIELSEIINAREVEEVVE
jgi:hypothetical protein